VLLDSLVQFPLMNALLILSVSVIFQFSCYRCRCICMKSQRFTCAVVTFVCSVAFQMALDVSRFVLFKFSVFKLLLGGPIRIVQTSRQVDRILRSKFEILFVCHLSCKVCCRLKEIWVLVTDSRDGPSFVIWQQLTTALALICVEMNDLANYYRYNTSTVGHFCTQSVIKRRHRHQNLNHGTSWWEGSPTAVQAWQPCPLWELSPSRPILV